MSVDEITNLFNVLKQDLKGCWEYFEDGNFQSMATLANRIMENCVFIKKCNYFLPGIMLRDISMDYQNILINNPSEIETAMEIGRKYITQIKKDFKFELDESRLWESFLEYSIEIRQFQNHTIEKRINRIIIL